MSKINVPITSGNLRYELQLSTDGKGGIADAVLESPVRRPSEAALAIARKHLTELNYSGRMIIHHIYGAA